MWKGILYMEGNYGKGRRIKEDGVKMEALLEGKGEGEEGKGRGGGGRARCSTTIRFPPAII